VSRSLCLVVGRAEGFKNNCIDISFLGDDNSSVGLGSFQRIGEMIHLL
jgi:hypothetical protein